MRTSLGSLYCIIQSTNIFPNCQNGPSVSSIWDRQASVLALAKTLQKIIKIVLLSYNACCSCNTLESEDQTNRAFRRLFLIWKSKSMLQGHVPRLDLEPIGGLHTLAHQHWQLLSLDIYILSPPPNTSNCKCNEIRIIYPNGPYETHVDVFWEQQKVKIKTLGQSSIPTEIDCTLARPDIRLAWGFQNFMQNIGNTQPIWGPMMLYSAFTTRTDWQWQHGFVNKPVEEASRQYYERIDRFQRAQMQDVLRIPLHLHLQSKFLQPDKNKETTQLSLVTTLYTSLKLIYIFLFSFADTLPAKEFTPWNQWGHKWNVVPQWSAVQQFDRCILKGGQAIRLSSGLPLVTCQGKQKQNRSLISNNEKGSGPLDWWRDPGSPLALNQCIHPATAASTPYCCPTAASNPISAEYRIVGTNSVTASWASVQSTQQLPHTYWKRKIGPGIWRPVGRQGCPVLLLPGHDQGKLLVVLIHQQWLQVLKMAPPLWQLHRNAIAKA